MLEQVPVRKILRSIEREKKLREMDSAKEKPNTKQQQQGQRGQDREKYIESDEGKQLERQNRANETGREQEQDHMEDIEIVSF